MTETVEDLKSAVRFYHNQADYKHLNLTYDRVVL